MEIFKGSELLIDYFKSLSNSNNINNEENELIDENKNIFKQFLEDPSKIYNDSKSFILFINELINQLNFGNNIIIPFLDLCPDLIKSYINCDLDEGVNLEYIKIFQLLKINSFISREYLFPIYEYFTDIFYDMDKIENNDIRLKKFNKVFELWKIFYDFNINENELKEINTSSYCFIKGGLKVNLSKEINVKEYSFQIKINLLNNIFNKFNEKEHYYYLELKIQIFLLIFLK